MTLRDALSIDLNDLSADLWVTENDRQVRYMFEMKPDRKSAMLVTKTYEVINDEFVCVGSVGEYVEQEIKDDTWRNDVLIWLVRGMWGIPLRYGKQHG